MKLLIKKMRLGTCRGVKSTIESKLKDQDQFGETFHMKLDGASDDLRSILGALCSLVLFLIVLGFAYLKADVLINKKDVDILSTVNDNFFTPDDVLNYSNGFNIAASFTAFDSETEDILDPTYGEIVFMHYYWGTQEGG